MKKNFTLILFTIGLNFCFAQTAYITNLNSANVSVIDVATNSLITAIPVGGSPYGVSVSPDGSTVYVTNRDDSTVSVISTATNTVIATIGWVGHHPQGIVVSPDGSKVYVVTDDGFDSQVSIIDAFTNTLSDSVELPSNAQSVCISPDGSTLYVNDTYYGNLTVVNTATNLITAAITVGYVPTSLAITPDGSKVYVRDYYGHFKVVNTSTGTVSSTILTWNGYFMTVSPDGSTLYVSAYNKLYVVNAATDTITDSISVGSGLPQGLSVTPDGSKLYVASFNYASVYIINTATNAIMDTVTAGFGSVAIGYFISTYTSPSCSGMPSAGTTLASSDTVCGSGKVTLSLSGINTFTGITYQWQQNVSGSGYSNIPGANSFSYTTPLLTSPQTIQFQCILTCSNSGLSDTSMPVSVYFLNRPSAPVVISGPDTVCTGNTVTFSTLPVVGATSYIWSYLPTTSWTGTSNTDSINLTATSSGGGQIYVRSFDNYCSSASKSRLIYREVCAGINDLENSQDVNIFPNPFSSATTISFTKEQKNTTIKIIDILGKEIKTINFTGKQLVIDKAEMKAGIYFVQTIDLQKHSSNTKIIIQ